MTAERMRWEAGPLSSPRPIPPLPEWWRTFPAEFETLEKVNLGRWDGDVFTLTAVVDEPIRYRYIGEFGDGEALMQRLAVREEP